MSSVESQPGRRRSPTSPQRASGSLASARPIPEVLPPGVHEHELGKEEERNKNRLLLAELHQKNVEHTNKFAQMQEDHSQHKGRVSSFTTDIGAKVEALSRQNDVVSETLRQIRMEQSNMQREFQQQIQACRQGLERVSQEHGLKSQEAQAKHRQVLEKCDGLAKTTTSNHEKVVKLATKLGQESGSDLKAVKQEMRKQTEELQRVKKIAAGAGEDLAKAGGPGQLAISEVRGLQKQLLDLGVLRPKKEVDPDAAEDELPPVGTLDLGEDIFTARLLLRLGFAKQKIDAIVNGEMSEPTSDGSEEERLTGKASPFENVTGIFVPELEADSKEYHTVVYGLMSVCSVTFLLQTLALGIMLRSGVDVGSTQGCFEEWPVSPVRWWTLHVSKLLAMAVAGTVMCRDLLNCINYWMAAKLLMPKDHLEATITTCVRIFMRVVLVAVNIVIFMSLTNPADVWLNMTALGFISDLSDDVLNVARSGVFGHSLSQATVPLNFQLTFVSQYPVWFKPVRTLALLSSIGAFLLMATITFMLPDQHCEPDEY